MGKRDETSHLENMVQCSICKEYFNPEEMETVQLNKSACCDCAAAIEPLNVLKSNIADFYQNIGTVDLNVKFREFFDTLNQKGVDKCKNFQVEIFREF